MLHYIDRDTVVSMARRLVAWPSEYTDELEMTPAVQSFVRDCVGGILQEHGIKAESDPFGNLRVVIGPKEAEIGLAIFTYAMTHPRSSMSDPFAATLVDRANGKAIRGRGVSEQKAAMAASLAAVIDLAKSENAQRRVAWFALTAGETGRHDAIAAALSALGETPKNGILAVGTDGKVSLGNRGRVDIKVSIEGRTAHSSTPWRGVNVVPAIAELIRTTMAINENLPVHDELGPASLTCTSIHTGPNATHTIQSEARLVFDRRLLPGEDPDTVFAQLSDSLSVATEPSVSLAKDVHMFGAEISRDNALLLGISQALTKVGIPSPDYYYSNGALDAGYLGVNGINATMWGPGETAQFHTAEETVLVDDLFTMTKNYRAVLQHLAAADK